MARPSVSLVIPSLNEEEGIVATLKRVPKGIDEIIVVDGNSKDRTRELAAAAGAKVLVEERRGYGLAYRRGFEAATGDIITTADADGTYPTEMLPHVIEFLTSRNLSFVSCSRFPLADAKSMAGLNKLEHRHEPGGDVPLSPPLPRHRVGYVGVPTRAALEDGPGHERLGVLARGEA